MWKKVADVHVESEDVQLGAWHGGSTSFAFVECISVCKSSSWHENASCICEHLFCCNERQLSQKLIT